MRRGDVNRCCIFCESFEGVFASPLLTYRMDPAKEGSLAALRSLPTRDVDSISPAGDDKAVLQDEPAGSHTFSPPIKSNLKEDVQFSSQSLLLQTTPKWEICSNISQRQSDLLLFGLLLPGLKCRTPILRSNWIHISSSNSLSMLPSLTCLTFPPRPRSRLL